MPSYPTVDLAQAYADAERILSLRGESARRDKLLQLDIDAQQQAAQQAKQLAEMQDLWAELQVSKGNQPLRADIARQIKEGAPQYNTWSDEDLLKLTEERMRVALGVKDEQQTTAPPMRTIYRGDVAIQQEFDGKTGTWADVGQGPRFQPRVAGQGEAPPKPMLVDVTLPDGTTQKQWVAPGQASGTPIGAPKPAKSPAANAMPLRKEFESQGSVKSYKEVLPLLVSARKAPDDGYGDLQLIYSAGKALDPGSVVREGELALTIAAGSPLSRILGTTRFSVEQGGRLPPQARRQLLGMINERALAYRQAFDADYARFAQYAQSQGLSPADVVGPHPANAYQKGKPKQERTTPENRVPRTEAPSAALEYLRQHPETKAAFFKKYGYLPNGR